MTTIQELQKEKDYNLNSVKEKDNKVHVLYVSPQFNARGYYRAITPALEINKSNTHKALISSVEQHNFSLNFDTNIISLDEELIVWSDYIILPTLMDDISYLIRAIRVIKKEVQIIMDIDRNYFQISKSTATKERISPRRIEQMISNLRKMDAISVSDNLIKKELNVLFGTEIKEGSLFIYKQASLLSQFGYEELKGLKKNDTSIVRIGLIKPTEKELLFLKEVFINLRVLFKEEIKFVCFGKPYGTKEVGNLLKEMDAEVHKTVSFAKYFDKLNNLSLDMVLLPVKGGPYFDEKRANIIKELAAFGIPLITTNNGLTEALIRDKETGFLVQEIEEWQITIERLIKDQKLRHEVGVNALKDVWKYHSFTRWNLDKLTAFLI